MKKRVINKLSIKEMLEQSTEIDTHYVSTKLNVSESTVRRLFSELVSEGIAIRTFGGIRIADMASREYLFDKRELEYTDIKKRIAEIASELIEDEDIIFLDSGTTTLHLAHIIASRAKNGEYKNLRIVTNSLAHLRVLSPQCKVTLIGGNFREKRQDFIGYTSFLTIENMNFSIAFLGTDGFSVKSGFSTTDEETAQFTSAIIERSRKSVMIFDASKLEAPSFINYAKVSDVDVIITNGILNKEQQKILKNAGTQYIHCSEVQQENEVRKENV